MAKCRRTGLVYLMRASGQKRLSPVLTSELPVTRPESLAGAGGGVLQDVGGRSPQHGYRSFALEHQRCSRTASEDLSLDNAFDLLGHRFSTAAFLPQ